MGSGTFAFPMRMAPNGGLLTREPGSDGEAEDAIAVLIQTRPGERPIFDTFGTPDPTFEGLDAGDVQAGLDEFGPAGIVIDDLEETWVDDAHVLVSLPYHREDVVDDEDGEDAEDWELDEDDSEEMGDDG